MPKDIDEIFAELRTTAVVLVRRVKDQAFDDAMLTLVSAMLDLRTRTENELLAEIDARLKPIGAAEKVL